MPKFMSYLNDYEVEVMEKGKATLKSYISDCVEDDEERKDGEDSDGASVSSAAKSGNKEVENMASSFYDNMRSPNLLPGLDEQPSLTETSEDQSLTFQKSVVDSQVDERADDPSYNGTWSCDLRCHPDPLAQSKEVPTPLSPHLHTPPSSFPETERSWRTNIPAGVNIQASAVSNTHVQSTHGSDVSTSSSAHVSDESSTLSSCDSKLYITGKQLIRKDRSHVIYPLNAYEPIAQNPVDLLITTDISSVNSTRSPTPSAGQEEDDERHIGPLAPEVSRRTLSDGLAVGDGRFERSRHPQQTRSPRGGNSLVTQALRPLNVGPARRRLVGDCAEGGRSGPQLPASLRPQQRRRRGQRGQCSRPAVPDLHSGKDPRHSVPPPAGPPSHLQGPRTARIRQRPQPSHLQGPRTARISRRPQPERLRRSTETTDEALSCSNCQLEYQRGPCLSRQRRQRHQHHSSACLHEDLLYYVLGKLDRPEYRCARREDAGRERTRNRGGDGCSTDSGDAGDASRDREGLGNDMHQQMVVRMLAQLQQQLTNDNASDGLAIENCSDVETVSSTASWSQQQQRQQPQQQQQQHDSALYSDVFCAVM
ncbi:hypothetical protein ACOMHN_022798 [Nucella lapillus]